ncbi:MAG: hypothetical protein Cons2KO_10060 [Congregibacter sp.]
MFLTSFFCLGEIAQAQPSHHGDFEPHHTVGVFLGDTTEDRRDGVTLGLEYEYRASTKWGLGLTAEHVAGDFDTNVLVLPVAHHRGPWKFYAGPGVEFADEGEEPLFRAGVEYGFHLGEFEVSPQIDVDFVDGERLIVFGVVIAREL